MYDVMSTNLSPPAMDLVFIKNQCWRRIHSIPDLSYSYGWVRSHIVTSCGNSWPSWASILVATGLCKNKQPGLGIGSKFSWSEVAFINE